uniref:Transposase n=1 Tax=Panagrolaimus sp. PS1159 TaxID=55785 RepID=A0AC35FTS1_9BILA
MVNSPTSLKRRLPFIDMENCCPEKRIKELAEKFEVSTKINRPQVCMRCVNGESGHITHHLESLPEDYQMKDA